MEVQLMDVYEHAKRLIPGLKLEIKQNFAAVYYGDFRLYDTTGPQYISYAISYLSGLIAGHNITKAN